MFPVRPGCHARALAVIVFVAFASSQILALGCRKDRPAATEDADASSRAVERAVARADEHPSADRGMGEDGSALSEAAPTEQPGPEEATGRLARGIEARAHEARRDAGVIDPACEGISLSLLGAAVDERCRAPDRVLRALVQGLDGGAVPARLRQEARREGDRVTLSLVNVGAAPIVVPLRFHPDRSDLPAFSVLAEDEKHGVFELMAPSPDVEAATARPHRRDERDAPQVHSARIRLPPGGAAKARIAIDPRVVKRLDGACPDAGPCTPVRLPKGHYALYVGQLVSAIDAGPPARVEWDVP